jgi:circadian clock protein KaiB
MTATDATDGTTLQQFEQALLELDRANYDLTLFVTGASVLSARAIAGVRTLCETHLHGRFQLHIVDVHENPGLVTSRGVLASPTLIKDSPLPKRVLVGDLSDTDRVLVALDIEPARAPDPGLV